MTSTTLLQNLLNGLAIGGVYAIFALGYTLVFSILRIINFAHGAVFTLGAYFTYTLTGASFSFNGLLANQALPFGLPFALALLGGATLAGLVSVLIDRLAFRPLRRRNADPLLMLVSSLGVAIALINLIQYLVGAENFSYPDTVLAWLPPAINFGSDTAPIPVRTVQILILLVSLVIVVLLTLFINRTRTGRALRALAEDPTMASMVGIDADRMIRLCFFLSGFIAGIAGTLVGLSVSINGPYFGIAFGLKGLAVIVLGGLGDIPGAIVGGLLLGLAEAFVPPEYVQYRDAIAFALLFVMLLARPEGLLGRATVQKV